MSVRYILYLVLICFGIVFGLIKNKSLNSFQNKLRYLLLWVFIIEVSGRVCAYTFKTSFPVYHFYLPGILIFHILFFKDFFVSYLSRTFVKIVGFILLPIVLFISQFYSSWIDFPSYQSVLISLYIVTSSLFCIKEMLEEPSLVPLHKQLKFVFCISNSFFYSINFFIFGLFDPFKKESLLIPEWEFDVLYFSNIILYSLYIYCLSIDEKFVERKYAIFKY